MNPNEAILRLEALRLALDLGKTFDAGEDEILAVAKKFYDFLNPSPQTPVSAYPLPPDTIISR